jgi:dipeptidyl aminopeptidase/acylaminoacyl peptidase
MLERPITAQAGSGAGVQVGPATGIALPEDYASTGAILYRTGLGSMTGGGDLFAVPPNKGAPVPVAQTLAAETKGRFSPDGNWIAYQSDEGGRNEVYVQPFPGTPAQRQRVSLNGGTSPQWGRKGRELYFISGDNRLMVATASSAENSRSLEFGTPKALFRSPLPQGAEYDTSRDGDRFLILAPVEEPPPIIVLTNWMPGN